jgi:hypothetical protein
MRPAFTSSRQAASVAALLAILLVLPVLVAKSERYRAHERYASIPVRFGPFAWVRRNIEDRTGDVDIAFLGSSHIWCAIDTPYIQKRLSEQLGRQADVFTLGWPWAGFDALYLVARDLLARRHVRTLVIYDESSVGGVPHPNASRLFDFGEDAEAIRGLPLLAQVQLYGGAVLGAPRRLLGWIRPDLTEDPILDRSNQWTVGYQASIRLRFAFCPSGDGCSGVGRGCCEL